MISASARRLSVFKAVVEEGGFNRAAMRLDISQPSVGAHVKALEQQAGQVPPQMAPVFDYLKKKMQERIAQLEKSAK